MEPKHIREKTMNENNHNAKGTKVYKRKMGERSCSVNKTKELKNFRINHINEKQRKLSVILMLTDMLSRQLEYVMMSSFSTIVILVCKTFQLRRHVICGNLKKQKHQGAREDLEEAANELCSECDQCSCSLVAFTLSSLSC